MKNEVVVIIVVVLMALGVIAGYLIGSASTGTSSAQNEPNLKIPGISVSCSVSQSNCILSVTQILGNRNVSGSGVVQWDCHFNALSGGQSCEGAIIVCPAVATHVNVTASETCSLQPTLPLPSAGTYYSGTIYLFAEPGGGGVPYQIPFGGYFS